jgi:hypothetical protein
MLEGHNSKGSDKQTNAWTIHSEHEDIMLM